MKTETIMQLFMSDEQKKKPNYVSHSYLGNKFDINKKNHIEIIKCTTEFIQRFSKYGYRLILGINGKQKMKITWYEELTRNNIITVIKFFEANCFDLDDHKKIRNIKAIIHFMEKECVFIDDSKVKKYLVGKRKIEIYDYEDLNNHLPNEICNLIKEFIY
jgi:hypothetical protein